MCGIFAILGSKEPEGELRKKALRLSKKLRHRGPDWNGICVQHVKSNNTFNALCHERLAIVDPESGAQPLLNESGTIAMTVNGEIYNHVALRKELAHHKFATGSDCEPIVYLFEDSQDSGDFSWINKLDGIFSFVAADSEKGTFLAARDPIGVTSLYIGWAKDGSLWFSSEYKALVNECERFEEFPPGHFWSSKFNEFRRWYNPPWYDDHIPTTPADLMAIRTTLENAVVKRLITDVPYGVLLSGGLDSSLIASLVARHAERRVEDNEQSKAWWPRLHSFTVGLKGAPDLKAAKEVADFLGTVHHEFHFTVQEGIDALSDVIYHIESYDVTTIRASTPMYFLTRKIKAMGVKMVLSGEGSDEIFGGYLYFHKAPSPEAFHKELCTKVKLLSKYDCLRAHKAPFSWGVEVRVPFLDKDFLNLIMGIDAKDKMITPERMEKYILRKAFDDPDKPYLPSSVLWRQKEQFSDGVGYSWIDGLKAFAEKEVTDEQMATASYRFPHNTPATKEAYLYRSIFHSHFPQESAARRVPGGPSIACSTPAAIEWDIAWKNKADPSGRAISGVHVQANPHDANSNAPTATTTKQ